MRISGHKINPLCARQTRANHAFFWTNVQLHTDSVLNFLSIVPSWTVVISPPPRSQDAQWGCSLRPWCYRICHCLPVFPPSLIEPFIIPAAWCLSRARKKSTKGRSILNSSGYCWHAMVNAPHTLSNVRNGALGPFSVKYHEYAHLQISYFTLQHHK